LPIDPNFVSRDIRREIGRETAEDLEQDRREFQVWTEKLKQDVRELGK
jgi:hypothetical protein